MDADGQTDERREAHPNSSKDGPGGRDCQRRCSNREQPEGFGAGTALLWEGIRPDTIFVPNTFGPRQVVSKESGAPEYEAANTLTADAYFDNLSGQQAYKCFACRIAKYAD